MEKDKILEGNKLIAEFMGGIYKSDKFTITEGYIWLPIENICRTSNLKYHSSFDWLMPVVEKIGKMYEDLVKKSYINRTTISYDIDTTYADVICRHVTIKLEHLFERVIEFIKWYNLTQNK